MDRNAIGESNCTSGKGSVIGSRLSASEDLCGLAPAMVGLISCATFLFLFIVVLCLLDRKRPKDPTKRLKQERDKYIDDRIIKKTVVRKRNVSSKDDRSISELERGDATKELHLHDLFQAQGSKVYLSFCKDEVNLNASPNGIDATGHTNQLPHAASMPACAICKEHYQEKDIICWSRNRQCDHVYHVECIKPWLMHHHECPYCRNSYLGQQNENERENGMEQPNSPGSQPILELDTSDDSPTLAEILQTMYHTQVVYNTSGDFYFTSVHSSRSYSTEASSGEYPAN